jgi:hypothetical protein
VHENCHFPFPGESKKNTREIDMLIGTSCRESVISLLLLVVILCGYQIYQFLKLVYYLFFLTKKKGTVCLKWNVHPNFRS